MSRRYAPQLLRTLLYALGSPLLILFGQLGRVRDFFKAKANINLNVPEVVADMTLGLNLLVWAFFLQLVSLFIH